MKMNINAYIISITLEKDIMISYCSVCQENISLPIISDKREFFPYSCPHCGRIFINSQIVVSDIY